MQPNIRAAKMQLPIREQSSSTNLGISYVASYYSLTYLAKTGSLDTFAPPSLLTQSLFPSYVCMLNLATCQFQTSLDGTLVVGGQSSKIYSYVRAVAERSHQLRLRKKPPANFVRSFRETFSFFLPWENGFPIPRRDLSLPFLK